MLDVAPLLLAAKAVEDLLRFPRSHKGTRIPFPWKVEFSGSKNPLGAWYSGNLYYLLFGSGEVTVEEMSEQAVVGVGFH